jgi:hopanoid biosynthesis associated protein HpnK
VRRLIINADDFGLTAAVNRGIREAHEKGVVTSATLMAGGAEFQDALRLSQALPRLSVGCHVVLADGAPVLPAFQVPSLIESCDTRGARFYPGWKGFGYQALRGRLDSRQIEAEATAQIRKLQSAGLSVSHVDTHQHLHVLPLVLEPLLRAARACGVRAIRNPFGPLRLMQLARWPALGKRELAAATTRMWAEKFRRKVADAGFSTPDGTFGISATGSLAQRMFAWLVERVPQGTWEFVCHPGYCDAQLQQVRTRLRQSRERELAILTSGETRSLLNRSGIELISYRDLT